MNMSYYDFSLNSLNEIIKRRRIPHCCDLKDIRSQLGFDEVFSENDISYLNSLLSILQYTYGTFTPEYNSFSDIYKHRRHNNVEYKSDLDIESFEVYFYHAFNQTDCDTPIQKNAYKQLKPKLPIWFYDVFEFLYNYRNIKSNYKIFHQVFKLNCTLHVKDDPDTSENRPMRPFITGFYTFKNEYFHLTSAPSFNNAPRIQSLMDTLTSALKSDPDNAYNICADFLGQPLCSRPNMPHSIVFYNSPYELVNSNHMYKQFERKFMQQDTYLKKIQNSGAFTPKSHTSTNTLSEIDLLNYCLLGTILVPFGDDAIESWISDLLKSYKSPYKSSYDTTTDLIKRIALIAVENTRSVPIFALRFYLVQVLKDKILQIFDDYAFEIYLRESYRKLLSNLKTSDLKPKDLSDLVLQNHHLQFSLNASLCMHDNAFIQMINTRAKPLIALYIECFYMRELNNIPNKMEPVE